MTETNNNSYNNSEEAQHNFQFKDFFNLIWKYKYYIVLSVIVCSAISLYMAFRHPRIYGSNAELIILNSNSNNFTGTGLAAFSDIKGMRSEVNMYNEMEVLKSPYIMTGVVERLNLNTIYTMPGFGYEIDIYKESPISVNFIDEKHNQARKFTVRKLDNDKLQISDFIISDKKINSKALIIPIGKIVNTPIGKIAVSKNEGFESFNSEIYVTRETIENMAKYYSSKVTAEPGAEYTSIIKLGISDKSQAKANDILNTLMNVYNESWISEKNRSAVNTSNFINERLAIIEKELSGIDKNISDVKSSSHMPDFASVTQNYYSQSMVYDNKVFEASNQLSIATFIREYLDDRNKSNDLIPANTGLSNGAIESQIHDYNSTLIKRNNLLLNSSETNPIVAELSDNLSSMRQVIAQSLDNIIESYKIQISEAEKRRNLFNSKISTVPEQEKDILSIERQQKVKENLYLYLLEKREENELTGMITVNNTRLIHEATSLGPVAPVRTDYLINGVLIGLAIPLLIIYLYLLFDTRVQNKNDLANLTIPLLGEIPLYGNSRRKNIFNHISKSMGNRAKNENQRVDIVVKEHCDNQINEAFRIARTNLDFMIDADSQSKVLMLTSFNPESGKTFISLNLAKSIALKGKRVIVADFDLRRRSLSQIVGRPSEGISSYLSGQTTDLQSLIIHNPDDEPFDILPSGITPPNPSELLLKENYDDIISKLREVYDYIILDCAPLGVVADTSIIARNADMSIFVVRAGLFDKALISELQDIYESERLPKLSVILNGVDTHRAKYKYGYGYYGKNI